MNNEINLEPGLIYYLKGFTAPKVFNGLYFECLLTDQKISANAEVDECTHIHIKNWSHSIWNKKRFGL